MRSKQQHMEVFGALCQADQLEIMMGGLVQADTATASVRIEKMLETECSDQSEAGAFCLQGLPLHTFTSLFDTLAT